VVRQQTIRFGRGLSGALGRLVVAGTLQKVGADGNAVERVLGSYALVAVTRGGGRYGDAQGQSSVVVAGDVLVLFPEIAHTYGPQAGGSWAESYVVFEGPVFDLWRQCRLLDPAKPVRRAPPTTAWRQQLQSLVVPSALGRRRAGIAEVCLIQQLLAGLVDHHGQAEPADADAGWLERARLLLDEDERRERALDDIAAELSLSYDGFRKKFRALAGVSPGRYRALASVDRACELMVTSQMTDRQIAAHLGYTDEFHFSHRFSALVGRSPRAFRRAVPR